MVSIGSYEMSSSDVPTLILYLFAFVVIRQFALILYRAFLRAPKNIKKYGQWAVVTGATDGIGRAFCFELARRGLNIVLISRTQSKLNETASELVAKFPNIQTKTIAIDFARFDGVAQSKVQSLFATTEVGVLINNVGMSYSFPEFFHQLDNNTIQQLIDLNVQSTTLMTHLALPSMVERKRGAIVCISSAASLMPSNPLLAQYAAAKAYVDKFAVALNAEYREKGVHVQVQNPLFVTTKLAKIRKASLTVPSPSSYARAGVNAIGYEAQTSPYWAHALQLWIMSFLPDSIVQSQISAMHKGLRKRALKKLEADASATNKAE